MTWIRMEDDRLCHADKIGRIELFGSMILSYESFIAPDEDIEADSEKYTCLYMAPEERDTDGQIDCNEHLGKQVFELLCKAIADGERLIDVRALELAALS